MTWTNIITILLWSPLIHFCILSHHRLSLCVLSAIYIDLYSSLGGVNVDATCRMKMNVCGQHVTVWHETVYLGDIGANTSINTRTPHTHAHTNTHTHTHTHTHKHTLTMAKWCDDTKTCCTGIASLPAHSRGLGSWPKAKGARVRDEIWMEELEDVLPPVRD